jgi:hypothetical protein
MRASATGMKASQATLKLPDGNGSLAAAGAATLKLPPQSVINASSNKLSSVMTLKPHQAMSLADIETVWDQAKAPNSHGIKMAVLPKGVDRMSGAFKDATKTKEEKRQMMDSLHETAMQRVAQTRKEMKEILAELAVYLEAFYTEYEGKLKVLLEELKADEEERVRKINERFKLIEERAARLQVSIDEEREARLFSTEAILGPARRSVELLVHDLEKERRIRHTRNDELNQREQDAVKMLSEVMDNETKVRETRHEQVQKELDIDVKRLQKRSVIIEQANAEKVAALQDDILSEEKLRKETQDDIVVKITDFVARFQIHVKEEGEMGC